MQKKLDINYKKIIDKFYKEDIGKEKSDFGNRIIRSRELYELGLCSRDVSDLMSAGKLERIKQGYYRVIEYNQEQSEEKLVAQLYPDGILCMYTALFYYGYSDRTPLGWDIAINRNISKSRFNIDYPYVNPHYMDIKHLSYGVVEIAFDGCVMNIFDKDRLICECIKHEHKMDKEIYNKAIKAYINDTEKNISNLMTYSKRRNIQNKVKERIGVWL